MRRITEILALRERVARTYEALLRDLATLILPPTDVMDVQVSWFVYVVRLTDTFSQDQRDAIVRILHQRGIACGRYFAPIHTQPAYSGFPVRWALPVTESVSRRTLALPFFSRLDDERLERVAVALRESIDAV